MITFGGLIRSEGSPVILPFLSKNSRNALIEAIFLDTEAEVIPSFSKDRMYEFKLVSLIFWTVPMPCLSR